MTQPEAPPVPGARRLFSRAAVDRAIARLATALGPTVQRGNGVLLGVLLGGMYPLMRLAPRLPGDFLIDACRASRYGDSLAGGRLDWLCEPRVSLEGKAVFLVDDIYDEGHTLAAIVRYCLERNAASVTTVVLVRKRHERPVADLEPDHVGLEVPDRYVFGCGMDVQGRWRHLPEIWALEGRQRT